MVTRIHDMPAYETRAGQLEAPLYNLWRRAQHHLTLPLRIELQGMKQMTLIIEHDCWVVVDPCQYDMPVLAWLEFQDAGRDTLHTPVDCTINYYHYLAEKLQDKVLLRMQETLEDLIKPADKGSADKDDVQDR